MKNDAPLNSSGVGDRADCLPEVRREWVKQREEEEGEGDGPHQTKREREGEVERKIRKRQ